jgi:preprotein translocase subunit SecG
LDDNTILTPDLESYKQIYPTDIPGLDNHFHIKGWDVSGSYYSYSMESYLCNFGNPDIYGINKFPELIFNISISRKFIDILICKIVPLMVVLVLLFTILFVRVKSDGFNNIIGCSGLFFVLVLDHINLRENVLSEQIMYLEYCYFFSYILLLLITITSFDMSKNGHSYNSWVDTVLKKYFWTVIFGAMAVVTAAFFR